MAAGSPDAPLSKFRVLILLQYYRPHSTGLTLHVQTLAEALVRRGHEVTVLTARHDRTFPAFAKENGVTVRRIWAPIRVSRGMIMPGHPIRVARALANADIVSIHTPMLETGFVGVLAALRGTPMVVTHHGDLVLPPGRSGALIERVVRLLHRTGMHLATTAIAYSADYAEHSVYLAGFEGKTTAIVPPIAIPHPTPDGASRFRDHLAPSGAALIGFAGRFVREKRPDVALHSLDTILRSHPNAVLAFAGEHDIRYEDTWVRLRQVIERYRPHVRFLGMIADRQELANFYAACDALVLTSDTECFGLVQVEAMLCGTPVVMTNIPGGRVPVTETGMGLLVRPDDPVAVGIAVCEILADPARFHRDRAEVTRLLGLESTIERYEEVFRSATNR